MLTRPAPLLLTLLAALAAQPALARQATGPAAPNPEERGFPLPTIQQVSPALDFGYGPPLAFLSDTVTITNSGDKPLTIAKAIGECSCTDATILGSSRTIAPGEPMDILVAVEFPREIGIYTKHVLLYEEGNERPYPLPFYFEVGYPIRVNSGARTAVVVTRTGTTRLESTTGTPFSVLAVNGAPPILEDFRTGVDAPATSYRVKHDWTEVPARDLQRWLIIETDHPGAEMIAVPAMIPGTTPVMDKSTARMAPMEYIVTLERMKRDTPVRFSLHFTGKGMIPGAVITPTSSSTDVEVTVVNARRPDRGGGIVMDFEATPRRGFTGFAPVVVSVEYDNARAAFDLYCRVGDPPAPASARSSSQ